MEKNKQTSNGKNFKWMLKRIFVEHFFVKLLAVVCGIMLWLCIGYIF